MTLSDFSVTRPVVAVVMSLILIAFGLVAFDRLQVREYPNIDPPVVSIDTEYPGTAAQVIETRITEVIEERIAGIEGIAFIESKSEDGRSRINIEFKTGRDVDAAANDVRDRVSGVVDNLPDEADPPDIQKVDSSDDVIMWFNLQSDRMSTEQLTDYADRFLVDRVSTLDGVARVRIGGARRYALRIWLDRNALAARGLVVNDVEEALRADNVELPAGRIESRQRYFIARVDRSFRQPSDFNNLVLSKGEGADLVRLGDVARIEKAAEEEKTLFRRNTIPMVGIGVIKQSQANTLDVAKVVKARIAQINTNLPVGMSIQDSYDSSVFIQGAIDEVFKTLGIAILLVVSVILIFLGSFRSMLVPAVTVPVSVIGACIILYALGLSINLLTLLAIVLAIGLLVDDAIVVLENIHRRIELGETPLVAAYRGTRQVAFAVVATTVVLLAVFVPVSFTEGDIGRLFSEFSLTMAAAVAISSFVALTLSPMLASRLLRPKERRKPLAVRVLDALFQPIQKAYRWILTVLVGVPILVLPLFGGLVFGAYWFYENTPAEYVPQEDRGVFYVFISGPEGASFEYMEDYIDEIERRMMPYVERGEIDRILVRSPRGFGRVENFNNGIVITGLAPWGERRPVTEIMADLRRDLSDLTGVRAVPVRRNGIGSRTRKPVQFVLGGGTYEELAAWRDILISAVEEDNPGFTGLDSDFKETKPQIRVEIDVNRAGDLGVSVSNIGRTLETFLGGRVVTTYIEGGQQYDVLLEGEAADQTRPGDINNIFVRSERTGQLIPLSNVVRIETYAGPATLNRYNRIRAITIEANLRDGYPLSEALDHLNRLVDEKLPETVSVQYKGQSADLQDSGQSLLFVFVLGVVVVFLVLAAQFESFVHPLVIMLTVPMAVGGALAGMYFTGGTLNLFTQIGLIMLVGLAAKNGILIVEFVNQLREQGMAFKEAIIEASVIRLRPIAMTGITTVAGSLPLVLAEGAGSENRQAIGMVIFSGVAAATVFTLIVVPAAYAVIARWTKPRGETRRRLDKELAAIGGEGAAAD
ncbi:MAG: efflux RND transporter permease subunit [Alphaproteobacteria bacterium]|nr:efflux RND transporter permease subunit [Alphaproteobacteria bacterium]